MKSFLGWGAFLRRLPAAAALIVALPLTTAAQSIKLAWDPDPAVAGYIVEFGTASQTYQQQIDLGNRTDYEMTGLDVTKTYFFAVRSYTEAGVKSAHSNEVMLRPQNATQPTDLDRSGSPDLLWQHDTTRQITAWYMGGPMGNIWQSWQWLIPQGIADWRIRAIADLDGDGVPDFVWQHETTRQITAWYMGGPYGTVLQRWHWLAEAHAPGWTFVAVADFNKDGWLDLVWQHDQTREVMVWFMGGQRGHVRQRWSWLTKAPLPTMELAAVSDFNADGVPDFVWLDAKTGRVSVWYMGGADGITYQGSAFVTDWAVFGWRPIGAADFDGDGVPDLAWQHDQTREVTVWYLGLASAHALRTWSWLTPGPVPGWRALVR